jgi:hypothetical protein
MSGDRTPTIPAARASRTSVSSFWGGQRIVASVANQSESASPMRPT